MQPAQHPMVVRRLGLVDYAVTYTQMRDFTAQRTPATADELWLLEHPPVFTLGTHSDTAHVLAAGDIPVVATDRGGQVTYHGPGQLVAYVLMDMTRAKLGVRELVCRLETAVIETLGHYGIAAAGRRDAPGVYTGGAKIASVGLRIRRGRSYHGIALNVNADLEPFTRINPCGYEGLAVTSTAQLGGPVAVATVLEDLLPELLAQLGSTELPA